jgi:uncharacterized protein YraI
MKRLITIALACWLVLAAVSPAAAQSGFWTGDYFTNANLSGAPVFTLSESSPAHNWVAGSPSPSIPADYFSVRWTSVQSLGGGSYQLTVRADDGVRVFIDGVVYIDQWIPSPGNTYTVAAALSAGQHTFVVEYFEATGNAFLEYSFAQISGGTSSTATVTTAELNVRDRPNPYTGLILLRITQGQTYPVIGKNADSTWLQLNVNGVTGWVNARYVAASNLHLVPVTDPGTLPSGASATVTTNQLNVRDRPNPFTGLILTRISRGQSYTVVGKNADSSWLQLNVNGTLGWVNARYVSATNLHLVAVTDPGTRPTGATATVITYFLNVRGIPDPINGVILTRISLGQTYTVVGKNAAATWVQLNVNGVIGWVNARYVAVSGLVNVPVIG